MEVYKFKRDFIEAEKLNCDIEATDRYGQKLYIMGGNYLIKVSDDKVYPADKDIFEFLFEKEDKNE